MSKNVNEIEKSCCCACGACMNSCPKQAISLKPDENGFIYPSINRDICIDCGLCVQVCNFHKKRINKSEKITYAAVTLDTDPLLSASGGLFASFAKHILKINGVVYGCAMQKDNDILSPKHIRVAQESDLYLLQGSKYVQSEIGLTYKQVQLDLQGNKTVLFSGTPCQVDGLRGFLRKEYDNLYTIDIICHGVPSVQLFQDYLKFLEYKFKKKIIDFKFRDKSNGWKLHGKIVLSDSSGNFQTIFFEPEESSYYQLFLNSYTYRENCYICPYACENRPGDITIGDYWCIDLIHPEMLVSNGGVFDEKKGISCLIVNNEQGKKLLELFGRGIERRQSTFEQASKYNGQLNHPSILTPQRAIVLKKYAQGYEVLDKWYRRKILPIKLKRAVRAAMPKSVKNWVKYIIRKG